MVNRVRKMKNVVTNANCTKCTCKVCFLYIVYININVSEEFVITSSLTCSSLYANTKVMQNTNVSFTDIMYAYVEY